VTLTRGQYGGQRQHRSFGIRDFEFSERTRGF
jgi:hypothetical protein